MCDVTCESRDACVALGADFGCTAGVCRAAPRDAGGSLPDASPPDAGPEYSGLCPQARDAPLRFPLPGAQGCGLTTMNPCPEAGSTEDALAQVISVFVDACNGPGEATLTVTIEGGCATWIHMRPDFAVSQNFIDCLAERLEGNSWDCAPGNACISLVLSLR
jgi:hypothetical protein